REVRIDEQMYELCKADVGRPAELHACLRRIAYESVELGTSALERGIGAHVLVPVETDVVERNLDEIPHRMALARRDDVVVRLVLLQHQVHGAHVISGVAPVAASVEVAEHELAFEAERDGGCAVRDLARKKLARPARRLVVVEDPRAREEAVAMAVRARGE